MTALTDLHVVVAERGREIDSGFPWPKLGVITLAGGIATILDALAAANTGNATNLEAAMTSLATELRTTASAAATAVASRG